MLLDPSYALAHAGRVAVAVVLIVLGKAVILGGVARAFGYVNMAPWIVGLGLAQIGEFSFVLARSGLGLGALSRATYDLVLTSTILTMALSPLVSAMALPLGRAWRRRRPSRGPSPASPLGEIPEDHAIIAGYGRTGKAAARALHAAHIPLVVVELDHSIYTDAAAEGLEGIWGDATSEEILHAAGVGRARVLVVTLPGQANVRLAVERAKRLNPQLAVVARASGSEDLAVLTRLGATAVVQPEFEGGLEMVRHALTRCTDDEPGVRRTINEVRDGYYGGA
jgi:CPA2 family monovalent cation:H+ antiporter-2